MDHEFYGRYRLVRLLGEGGMATVFLAEDPVLRRPVALKRLKRELGAKPDWVRRFHSEATSVARLGNPHVVQVFDLGRDHEEDYLVMELVEGLSLSALLARIDATLPADAAAAIAFQAASGLAAAHEAAVVHRDVKPDNILIRRDGTAKVADFGIARLTEEISKTMTGTVMGSPLYMAPEQVEGKTPTGALDLFALGSVLYHMLSGRTPFEADHAHAVMWRIVSESHVPLPQLVPGIDPTLSDLVDLLLRKDPLGRPSATETARILRQFLSAGGIDDPIEFVRARVLPDDVRRAAPVSVSPKLVGGTLPDAAPRPRPTPPVPRPGGRRTLLIAASGCALLTVVLAGALLVHGIRTRKNPEPSSPPSGQNPSTMEQPAIRHEPQAPKTRPAKTSESPATGVVAPVTPGSSEIAVTARDEAPNEHNGLKPRLVFRNNHSRTIHHFRMEWNLPGDFSKKPQIDAYYSPNCASTLAPSGTGIRLTVECSDLNLRPGQVHPGPDGLSLGIHYPDWADWRDKGSWGVGKDMSLLTAAKVEVLP